MTRNIDFYELVALVFKERLQVRDRLSGFASAHRNLNNLSRGIALFDRTEEPLQGAF